MSCPRAGCGKICMSGSMSGVWKRSQGRTSEAPPDERGRQQICSAYSHRATLRLYHEERFPPTRLSAGYGFRKETIAGVRHNGRDAPIPDARRSGVPLRSLTDSGPSSRRAHRRRCATRRHAACTPATASGAVASGARPTLGFAGLASVGFDCQAPLC